MRILLIAAALMLCAGAASADPVKLCTGGTAGNYYAVGNLIKQQSGGAVEVISTAGSWQNLQKLQDGSCDAAIAQSDAPDVFKAETHQLPTMQRVTALYNEYANLICNVKAGVESVGDLSDKTKIIVGQEGSGSYLTWSNFIAQDDGYADIPTVPGGSPANNFLTIQDGEEAQCLLFITGKNSAVLQDFASNSGGQLRMVDVDDNDFNDGETAGGEDIYTWSKVPNYDGFEGRWTDVETLALRAVLYVRKDYVAAHADDFAAFTLAVKKAMPQIRADYGKLE